MYIALNIASHRAPVLHSTWRNVAAPQVKKRARLLPSLSNERVHAQWKHCPFNMLIFNSRHKSVRARM
jgi:hypothetical protein